MDNNPYSAPDSNVANEMNTGKFHPPRRVPIKNGVQWISDGFTHFSQDAGSWILICIVGFAIMMALNFIPLINILAGFTSAIWTGGLMLGCRAQDKGEGININYLFAGFSTKPWQLLLITAISIVLTVAILMVIGIALVSFYGMGYVFNDPQQLLSTESWTPLLLALLIFFALTLPVFAMVWFAPALVILEDVPVFTAFGLSFKACLINFLPMLPYGLILMVLFILGSLPLFLGLLVVMPVFYGSIYRSYQDIFIN